MMALPRDEVLNQRFMTQLAAHPSMDWLEGNDVVGAFEALRDVSAFGEKGNLDDIEALTRFMDLVATKSDFTSGSDFWQNVYRLWLAHYTRLVNVGFQDRLRKFVVEFNSEHAQYGLVVVCHSAAPKSFEELKAKEVKLGQPGPQCSSRMVASSMLDVVRCSMTANSPSAVVALVEAFQKVSMQGSQRSRLELVRIQNLFHPEADVSQDVPTLKLNLLHVARDRNIIGEVQVMLPEFLAIEKQMWPLTRFLRTEDLEQPSQKNGCCKDIGRNGCVSVGASGELTDQDSNERKVHTPSKCST